jgi:hypothetical protein
VPSRDVAWLRVWPWVCQLGVTQMGQASDTPQWPAQCNSAVQSRVGDGFPVCLLKIESKTGATKLVARLPEHEVRDDCWGPKPAGGYGVPQLHCGAEVDEKSYWDVGSKFTRGRPLGPCSTVNGV